MGNLPLSGGAWRAFRLPLAGCGLDSRITVWQLRHWNVSKSAKSSRDLLACMAIPQTGQWRMRGRGLAVNCRSGRRGRDVKGSPNTTAPELIQINAVCSRCGAPLSATTPATAADFAQHDLGQCVG